MIPPPAEHFGGSLFSIKGHSNLNTMMMTPNSSSASIPLFSSGSSTPNPPPAANRKRSDGSSDTYHSISSFTPNDEAYFAPQWGPHFYAVPPKRNQGTAASKKRSERADMPTFKDAKVSMFLI
jgi:hypothetical protein